MLVGLVKSLMTKRKMMTVIFWRPNRLETFYKKQTNNIDHFMNLSKLSFLSLLWVTMFLNPCNGQVKKSLLKGNETTSNTQPKLIHRSTNPGDNVHGGLQDKEGNLWFVTTGDGVYRYDGKSFAQFTTTNGLNSNNVNCILEDKDGKIWIGTVAGACLYDGKTFTEIKIPLPKSLAPNKYHNTHDVFSIMQDKSGKLWFATIDGVYVYDGKSFTSFIVNEGVGGYKSSNNNNVEYILEDKAGNLWFGGRVNKGVFRYDGKSITNLKPDGDNWAWPVLQDRKGNIWFSNWNGAYRYDGKSFTTFTKNDGLCSDGVSRITEDKNGNLWFAGGDGICRYDGKTFTCLTTKDGLANKGIWSILEDKNGDLWIGSSNTGLCRFDGNTFTSFSE
jgi:ligand-binding sensor domain-containing protein